MCQFSNGCWYLHTQIHMIIRSDSSSLKLTRSQVFDPIVNGPMSGRSSHSNERFLVVESTDEFSHEFHSVHGHHDHHWVDPRQAEENRNFQDVL